MASVIGIVGDVGCGKTALLSIYLYDAFLKGIPIIANYRLDFHYLQLGFDQLADAKPDVLFMAYIGTDELHQGADSYDFLSTRNRKLSRILTERRKAVATWIFTVQRLGLITKRIRDQVERYILPIDDDYDDVNHSIVDKDGHPTLCAGLFSATVYDANLQVIRSFRYNNHIIKHLYNSREIIRAD